MGDLAPHISPDRYRHLTAPESTAQVTEAMRAFLADGDENAFEYAVTLYVASARARHEPIEAVVSALRQVSEALEGTQQILAVTPPTRLRELTFRGILRAFYGEEGAPTGDVSSG